MINIKLEGLKAAIKTVEPERLKGICKKALSAYALKVDSDAKLRCPVDLGQLRSSINPVTDNLDNLEVSFVAGVDYAAYVEFGTGPYAAKYVPSLDPEWQKIAKKYYINGEGRMPAQPFLYPAVINNLPLINKKLEELL